jgi:hypothetical protein
MILLLYRFFLVLYFEYCAYWDKSTIFNLCAFSLQ